MPVIVFQGAGFNVFSWSSNGRHFALLCC